MQIVQFEHGWKALVAACLLTLGSTEPCPAQKSTVQQQRGDMTIEAGGYLNQAASDLECSPESSKTWVEKAFKTLDSVKQKDAVTLEMVANARLDGKAKMTAAESRINRLTQTAEQVRGLLKQARLETAQDELNRADAKECYAGFRDLRSKILQRQESAADNVRLGDATLSTNRSRALSYYRKAQKDDSDYPGLDDKLTSATKQKYRRPKPYYNNY